MREWDTGSQIKHRRILQRLSAADPTLYNDPCAALLFARVTTALKTRLVLGKPGQ